MSAKLMRAVDSVSARTTLVCRCVAGMARQSIVASVLVWHTTLTPAGTLLAVMRVPFMNPGYCSSTVMLAAGTPAAIMASMNGSTSSLFVPIFCVAMPLTLTHTLSSGCTKDLAASARSLLPVNSSRARRSISLASSAFGKRRLASRQPALLTLTTRPGADSGTKPAGGWAARAGCVRAPAGLEDRRVAAAPAAAAPPRKWRRDAPAAPAPPRPRHGRGGAARQHSRRARQSVGAPRSVALRLARSDGHVGPEHRREHAAIRPLLGRTGVDDRARRKPDVPARREVRAGLRTSRRDRHRTGVLRSSRTYRRARMAIPR